MSNETAINKSGGSTKTSAAKIKLKGGNKPSTVCNANSENGPEPDDLSDVRVGGSPSASGEPKTFEVGGGIQTLMEAIAPKKISAPERVITDQAGRACLVIREGLHPVAVPIESQRGQAIVRQELIRNGGAANRNTMRELTDNLLAHAEAQGDQEQTYHRVAPCEGGIEISLGDKQHSRIRVTSNGVELMSESSVNIFTIPTTSLELPMSAEKGSREVLQQLLNIEGVDFELLIAWITYTLSHPKVEGSKYVFLVLSGSQGSGKSFMSNLLSKLIDPSSIGIQAMPSRQQDLALVLQSLHVAVFDNMRNVKSTTSDLLCMASTGGTINDRKLYTDTGISTKSLHGAIIFNGIHRFLHQSDLAQRCLNISLHSLPGWSVRSEQELLTTFEAHHPAIFRYLLDVIARVFSRLPEAKPISPERMIDFCYWLSAYETSEQLEEGVLQKAYSDNLNQTQLDSLLDNIVAAHIIKFCEQEGGSKWEGTPADLLQELGRVADPNTRYSREWPRNPIALGRRLPGLKAGLGRQGILMDITRGSKRQITLHIDPRVYPIRED